MQEEGFPVYGANGIIGRYKEYNHEYPVVAITCRGATCGSINITVPKAYITGNAMCLDDVSSDIDLKYLYYCLLHYDFSKVISGTAQPQITRQSLEKVVISIGTPEEQKEIVYVLKKIENIINGRKHELLALDNLIKARFVEMFGDPELNPKKWPIETLGDVLSVEPQNGLYKPQSDYVQDGTGIPILRIDAFYDGKVTDLSGLKRLNCTDTERSRYLLVENDIVINPKSLKTCTQFLRGQRIISCIPEPLSSLGILANPIVS